MIDTPTPGPGPGASEPDPTPGPDAPSPATGPPVPDAGAGEARRRRGRPSAGVREAILAATLDLAAEQGLTRLTTKEVARRAGASEASVFYHFGDKVGLLQAAMVAGLEPLMELDPAILGACLLRSWQRYLFGPQRSETIPGLPRTIGAIADLLQAPGG